MPIANNDSDKEARPLDPIYALSTHRITHGAAKRYKRKLSATEYNQWRESLPDRCWECPIFDSCYPKHKCEHNPANNE